MDSDKVVLLEAIERGDEETIKSLTQGEDRSEVYDRLLIYASRGLTHYVRVLLDAGANVHAQNDAALIEAATIGSVATVELLLEYGADVHAQNEKALLYAVNSCRVDVVRVLIAAGANVDRALILATARNYPDVVAVLLCTNVDRDTKNNALAAAIDWGAVHIVDILLEHGADVECDNNALLRHAIVKWNPHMFESALRYLVNVPEDLLNTSLFVALADWSVATGFWHPSFETYPLLLCTRQQINDLICEELGDDSAFHIFSQVYSQ